jgi:hypothetical protein
MTALAIESPFPVFTGLDGKPLDNGRIYVGVANLDPVTNPVAVYWDDALSISASQPVATSGGYAVYLGSPAQLYADAALVSIRVEDGAGALVFSANSVAAFSVGLSGGTTGLTVTGSPVTGSGTITLGGTLVVANGGTGSGTAAGARANLGAAASGANTDITALDQDVTVTATGTIAAGSIGFRGVPQNAQTAAYTLALADAGRHIAITTGGVIIPLNSSVGFPIGTTIVIFNNSNATQSITITTGDTLRQAGTTNTGTRTLAVYGVASLIKVATTVWVITGNVS